MQDSDDEKNSYGAAALPVADVKLQLPGPEKEIAVVFKFTAPWVGEALTAAGINVGDLRDHGEFKTALIKYYQGLNTAVSEIRATEATGAPSPSAGAASEVRATEATGAPLLSAGSLRHILWAKGALLQNAPSLNKISTAGLRIDGRKFEVANGLDRQGMGRPARHVALAHRRDRRGLR